MSSEDKAVVYANEQVLIQVRGQNPLEAPSALFSNFLSISRVATDVQFEFVFLDLNQVVQIIEAGKQPKKEPSSPITGQTVAKIIMSANVFVQLKDHIAKMMADIEKNLAHLEEGKNADIDERQATSS
jgi:hypothetical protein